MISRFRVVVTTTVLFYISFSACVIICSHAVGAWIIRSPPSIVSQRLTGQRTQATRVTAMSTTNPSFTAIMDAADDCRPSSTVIIGGGPTGIFTALMLARRGYKGITVLERLAEPPPPASSEWGNPERSYNLGIGGRGQLALAKIGAAERVFSWCADAMGRKDWNPQSPEGSERSFSERKFRTKMIARDRLTSCLLEEARTVYPDAIAVRFGVECTAVKWLEPGGSTGGILTLKNASDGDNGGEETSELTAEFVVAADGVRSEVRDALERDRELTRVLSGSELRVKRFPRQNEFVYKIVSFRLDSSWRSLMAIFPLLFFKLSTTAVLWKPFAFFWGGCYGRSDFSYSHRTKEGINLEALPTKEGMQVGALLFRPDNQRVLGLKTAADARVLFKELFPQFADMITEDAYHKFVQQKFSRLPSFSYAGPVLHLGKSAVLLGDAIKSVKPYFGLGVNSAFEDCIELERCLEEAGDDLSVALPRYSRSRAPEAKTLVELSRGFDRTGVAGLFGFIIPLVFDSIFHRAAPRIFAPNTMTVLQRPGMSFMRVRLRKALDRVMQGAVVATAGLAALAAVRLGLSVVGPSVLSFFVASPPV